MTIATGSTLLLSGKKVDDQLRKNEDYCYSVDQIEPKHASKRSNIDQTNDRVPYDFNP